MDSIFDLPAHALVLDAPVVLVPLSLIVSFVMVRESWRRQHRRPHVRCTGHEGSKQVWAGKVQTSE